MSTNDSVVASDYVEQEAELDMIACVREGFTGLALDAMVRLARPECRQAWVNLASDRYIRHNGVITMDCSELSFVTNACTVRIGLDADKPYYIVNGVTP
jgi:hypothetical protein